MRNKWNCGLLEIWRYIGVRLTCETNKYTLPTFRLTTEKHAQNNQTVLSRPRY